MEKQEKEKLSNRIEEMSGAERFEHWRNQTLINRISNDDQIACEYYTLIKFIEKEYLERFECIQDPVLNLISHCLELKYKCTINHCLEQGLLNKKPSSHEHELMKFKPAILNIIKFLSRNCSSEDILYFKDIFPNAHTQIINLLKRETTTYRYSKKIDANGVVIKNGHPFNEDYDSPNMLDTFKFFDLCYDSLSYINDIIALHYSNTQQQ